MILSGTGMMVPCLRSIPRCWKLVANCWRRRKVDRHRRRLVFEPLEVRHVLSAIPWGAAPADTGEFMLGSVTVTLVLMESNGQTDPSTENWTPQLIQQVKQKVQEGVNWWRETLANYTSIHSLDFVFDFTYADNPVPTRYEPINRTSDAYTLWVNEFLDFVGFNSPQSIDEDIRLFNHAQRLAHDTNWAFTIFVVNATNDLDGQFAPGGSFTQAFAFAGGRFIVAPSTRPTSTFAHETGHIFWARDEYLGGGSWTDRRGYYDTQNWNAADNPTPGFVQQDSIMAAGTKLLNAFTAHVSAPSTLAQVGWQDSDGDGVFDVLDVPHELSGIGYRDPATGKYRFVGRAEVGTLPNRNSSGLQNDITINTITRAEFRIDGGPWTTAAPFGTYTADLNLSINVPAGVHTVEIRTISLDPITGQLVTSSPVFTGLTNRPTQIGNFSLAGFVWNDVDGDGVWDAKEIGLPGQAVRLIDALGNPVSTRNGLEPDDFDDATILNNARSGLNLSAVGWATANERVLSRDATLASTGNRVFAFAASPVSVGLDWRRDAQELHIRFDAPQSFVSIDAIGINNDSYGRLEAYDGSGALIARYNTGKLAAGQRETMRIARTAADVVLVKAFGRASTSVALDNLRYGPEASTSSGLFGAYALGPLPAATYFIELQPALAGQLTAPSGGFFTVNLQTGQTASDLAFGFRPNRPWRNPVRAVDVSADWLLTTFDVLALLTELSRNGARQLPAPTDLVGPAPFLDVNGDNALTTLDVFPVLSALRSGSGSGESPAGSPYRVSNPPSGDQWVGITSSTSSGTQPNRLPLAGLLEASHGHPSKSSTLRLSTVGSEVLQPNHSDAVWAAAASEPPGEPSAVSARLPTMLTAVRSRNVVGVRPVLDLDRPAASSFGKVTVSNGTGSAATSCDRTLVPGHIRSSTLSRTTGLQESLVDKVLRDGWNEEVWTA